MRVIGMDKYQEASLEGEGRSGGYDCSKWVLEKLSTLEVGGGDTLSLLDVGAIVHRFGERCTAGGRSVKLAATSIDLNPSTCERGQKVIKADFFDFASERIREGARYDVVCLSLCINFEGSAKKRGEMVRLAGRLLKDGGYAMIVLPKACLDNSRYCDESIMHEVMQVCGIKVAHTDSSQKLWRCVGRRTGDVEKEEVPRRAARGGSGRNNFAVVLESAGNHGQSGTPTKMKASKKGGLTLRNGRLRGKTAIELTSNQRRRARKQAWRAQKNGARPREGR